MRVFARRNWSAGSVSMLLALIALALWFSRQPLLDIVAIGLRDDEQSHIFLAPVVAAWLLWLRRSRLRYALCQPSLAGPALLMLGWLISWWGFTSGTQIAWHGGAVMTVLGAIMTMTGVIPLQLFAPVFFVLLFMLPVPGEIRHRIALPMQDMATSITHFMLELIGNNAVRSGNVLIINGQQVAVGEACNGMRMVFALTLVVYAFAFGTPLKPATRMVLIVLSPLVALVCNVIRLVPTGLIFGYGTTQMAENFHDYAGWVMLPVALMMMAGVLRTIRWLEFPVSPFRLARQ